MKKLQKSIDDITSAISGFMIALMMLILVVNIILRYLPGIGGFKWYMEMSQYLNVWAMFIAGIGITAMNEHLNVQILDSMTTGKANKIVHLMNSIFVLIFYLLLAYATYLLAKNSRQDISTMPMFKMSVVYWLMPISCLLSAISSVIVIIAEWNTQSEKSDFQGGEHQ